MPSYTVTGLGLAKPRVVEAANPAAARQHVAAGLEVNRIEVSEAFALAADGVKLEKAGDPQPEPEEPEERPDPGLRPMDQPLQDFGQREPFDAGDEELEGN